MRHRRRLQARAGALRRRLRHPEAPSRSRCARDDRRRRPAAGREPQPRDSGPARARAHAEARTAGADERRGRRSCRRRRRLGRLPARAAHQRCRPARSSALHLLLTDDAEEARLLADTLEELNHERQAVEGRILREAIVQVEQWPEADKRRRAYVVAGEDWHEGVIGIVASRLVERFNRPVVLIAGGDGEWKGSGRSIASFDLHGGLGACSDLLERWGGHRAAAGLSIKPENIPAFAERFAAHAAGLLEEEDLLPTTRVDGIVPRGTRLTLDLCAELAQLAPFGLGNPEVTLLAPGCELGDLATVGEGKHLRFRVRRDGSDAGSA